MNNRKYSFGMFCMGTIINLLRLWPYFIVVIILSVICLVKPVVPIVIPIVLVGILALIAIMQQFSNKKLLLSHFENEKTNELLDKIFTDNSKGYKNVTDTVDKIIINYKNER